MSRRRLTARARASSFRPVATCVGSASGHSAAGPPGDPLQDGVGYFEHLGSVRNDESVAVRFTSAQLNDVLNSLTVLDLGSGQASMFLSEMNSQTIEALTATGISVATIEKVMKPVFDKRGELAAIDRRLETLQKEAATIGNDQNRLRENLKALKGSPEERALVLRYTRQLDRQESRLDVLKSQVGLATAEREKAMAELNALVAAVSFDEIVP